jgi:hypothetical protein
VAVIGVEHVSSIDKTVRNASAQNKSRLISANEIWIMRLQPRRQVGNGFNGGVLQSNGTKVLRFPSIFLLREEDKE